MSTEAPATAAALPDDGAEEKTCRYCFEGGGELIAPCRCTGGQRWVHLSCLRSWQRALLVSQPTHPEEYNDSDVRHKICNVCKSEYSCKPPTRLELLESFTGAELASLVEEGCLIGSSKTFSDLVRRRLKALRIDTRSQKGDRHWFKCVMLIVSVVRDTGAEIKLCLPNKEAREHFTAELTDDWCIHLKGRQFRMLFKGNLANAASGDRAEKCKALEALKVPCTICMVPTAGADCAEDSISAVSLTRPVDISYGQMHIKKRVLFSLALPDEEAFIPEVTHFIGGPCYKDKAQYSIVIAGSGDEAARKVYSSLEKALADAQALAKGPCSSVHPNAKRQRTDAGADSQENGSLAQSQDRSMPSAPQVIHANYEKVRVYVFWGTAGWSRCQLMGEIASGSWGLSNPSLAEDRTTPVFATRAAELHEAVYPRMLFAPKNQMTEDHDEEGQLWTELRTSRQTLARLRQRERMLQEAADAYRRIAESYAQRLSEERRLAETEAPGNAP